MSPPEIKLGIYYLLGKWSHWLNTLAFLVASTLPLVVYSMALSWKSVLVSFYHHCLRVGRDLLFMLTKIVSTLLSRLERAKKLQEQKEKEMFEKQQQQQQEIAAGEKC